jgi:hypothetical protein
VETPGGKNVFHPTFLCFIGLVEYLFMTGLGFNPTGKTSEISKYFDSANPTTYANLTVEPASNRWFYSSSTNPMPARLFIR